LNIMTLLRRKLKARFSWLPALSAALVFATGSAGAKLPEPVGYVNDFARILSPAEESEISDLISSIVASTRVEVAVVTVDSTGDPFDYATRLYEKWKIGSKTTDEGLLVLLSLDPRQVVVETGYGLEGVLPDGRVGEILDRYVVPDLRRGNYGRALYMGVAEAGRIVAAEKGVSIERVAPSRAPARRTRSRGMGLIGLLPLVLIFLALSRGGRRSGLFWILLFSMMGGGRGGYWGGGGGGFGGGFGAFGGGATGGGGASRGF